MLRGTLSPTVRSDQAALREYFVTAFKVVPSLKVAFGDQLIRVYGKTSARKRRRLSQRLEQFVLDLKRVNAHLAAADYPILEGRGELLPSA